MPSSILSDIKFLIILLCSFLTVAFSYGSAIIVSRNILGRSCRLGKRDILIAVAGNILIETSNVVITVFFFVRYFMAMDPGLEGDASADEIAKIRLPQDEYYALSVVANLALLLIFFFIFLLKHKKKRISSALTATLVFYSLHSIVRGLFYNLTLLASNNWKQSYDALFYSIEFDSTSLTANLIIVLADAAIFLTLYFRLFKKDMMLGIKPVYIVILCISVILISSAANMPFSFDYTEDQINYYARILLGIFIPLIMLAVALILVLNNLRENQKAANENQARYLEAELSYIAQYKKNENETRKFRHDIINNLSLMDMMVKEGHIDEAREHLRQMLENINSLSRRFSTGDEMLDLIVTMKADVMEDEKIAFNCTGSFENGLDMKAFDTCGIFAEALDSAIKVCKAEKGIKDPEINMTLTETDTSRMISIKNNCIGNGSFNLDNSCIRSYGGTVRVLKKDDVTELILTLPKTRKKEAKTA